MLLIFQAQFTDLQSRKQEGEGMNSSVSSSSHLFAQMLQGHCGPDVKGEDGWRGRQLSVKANMR